MFRKLIAFPLLALVVMLQSAVISRITLLAGFADLMLIVLAAWSLKVEPEDAWLWAIVGGSMIAFISGVPWPVILGGYLFVVFLSQVLRSRVWQAPILAMLIVTFLGTMLMNFVSLIVLQVFGRPLPFSESIGLIALPSLLLNLLFSIPVYVIMRDLAQWLSPASEVE